MKGLIVLMKTLEQVAADYGLTPDGVSFVLEQYQKVIVEITHSRMSKLSYYADDILSVANDVWCNGCVFDGMAEPYVLSITEVIDSEDEYWLESVNGGNGYGDVCIDGNGDYAFYSAHVIRGVDIDAYGKTWRCWNIKPSDEQRKNTPWKE